jgi:1,4-dihydroxy-2-naphthoyl-CoA hydrolase
MDLVSTARVTMLVASSPLRPEEMTSHEATIKKYAKL